jgi:hypothetical protein
MSAMELIQALRQIIDLHDYIPSIRAVCKACDTGNLRRVISQVNAALCDPLVRSATLKVAIQMWGHEVNRGTGKISSD